MLLPARFTRRLTDKYPKGNRFSETHDFKIDLATEHYILQTLHPNSETAGFHAVCSVNLAISQVSYDCIRIRWIL